MIEKDHLGDWSPEKECCCPFQDSNHRDDLFQSRYVTPGFKPFSYLQLIARNCDWLIALFAPVVIGRSNCFGFDFSTVI